MAIHRVVDRLSVELGFDKSMLSIENRDSTRIINLHPTAERDYPPQKAHVTSRNDLTWQQLLDAIYQTMHRCFGISDKKWMTEDARRSYALHPHGYWLNLLFDVRIVATSKDMLYQIVEYTDRRDGRALTLYLAYDETYNGWYPHHAHEPVFLPLLQALNPIETIKITVDLKFNHAYADVIKGELNLKPSFYKNKELNLLEIISESSQKVEFMYTKIDAQDASNIKSECKHHTVYIEDRHMYRKAIELPIPEWISQVRDFRDLIKNPTNTHIHEILPEDDVPIYEGKRIYITSLDDTYVNLEGMWILVNKEWLVNRKGDMPFLAEDMLALELIGITLS